MTRYSQNDEQDFILKFFDGFVGALLEIGAFDGITFSNTRALLERQWNGILAEPDPRNVAKLIENCEDFQVLIFPVAIGPKEQVFEDLRMDATKDRGWSSTISGRCRESVLMPLRNHVRVPVMSIATICAFQPFQFISIDAEGMDFDILKAMPMGTLKACRLLCIEPHNLQEREEMRTWLDKAGFSTVHETPENLIACQKH